MALTQYADPTLPQLAFNHDPMPVALPEGVIGHKVKLRTGAFTVIYLRYPDRVEQWVACIRDGQLHPYIRKSANYRHQD